MVDIEIKNNIIKIAYKEKVYSIYPTGGIKPYLMLMETVDNFDWFGSIQPFGYRAKNRDIISVSLTKYYVDSQLIETEIQEPIIRKLCEYFGVDYSMRIVLGEVVSQYINHKPIDLNLAFKSAFPIIGINYFEALNQVSKGGDVEKYHALLYRVTMFNIDLNIIKPITKLTHGDFDFEGNSIYYQLCQMLTNISLIGFGKAIIDISWSEKRIHSEYKRLIKQYDFNNIQDVEYNYNMETLKPLTDKGFKIMSSLKEVCQLGLEKGNCLFGYYKSPSTIMVNNILIPYNIILYKDDVIYKVDFKYSERKGYVSEYIKTFNRSVNEYDCYVSELNHFFNTVDMFEIVTDLSPKYPEIPNVPIYDMNLNEVESL